MTKKNTHKITVKISKNYSRNVLKINPSFNDLYIKVYELLKYDGFLVGNFEDYLFEISNEFEAQVAWIEIDEKKQYFYFSQLLDDKGKEKARNTFLAQNFLAFYLKIPKSDREIYASLNPYSFNKDYSHLEKPNSIKLNIIEMTGLGVKFGKSLVNENQKIPATIEEYLKLKESLKNERNNSSFIKHQNGVVTVYGKIKGANLKHALLMCLFLRSQKERWNIKSLKFVYFLKPDEIENFNEIKEIKRLEEYGFQIENSYEIVKNIDIEKCAKNFENEIESKDIEIKRYQKLFKQNIITNYGIDKFCYACEYNIFDNLIASHIHRVTDINYEFKSGELTKEKAQEQIVDGYNGFLFCPNHDKAFEKGQIFWNIKTKKFEVNAKNMNQSQILYLKTSLTNKEFNIPKDTEMFILKHLKRHSINT